MILPLETGPVMGDVGRRLVERRGPQLVMAASAGDHEMAHAPALRGCAYRVDWGPVPARTPTGGLPESRAGRILSRCSPRWCPGARSCPGCCRLPTWRPG